MLTICGACCALLRISVCSNATHVSFRACVTRRNLKEEEAKLTPRDTYGLQAGMRVAEAMAEAFRHSGHLEVNFVKVVQVNNEGTELLDADHSGPVPYELTRRTNSS